jgi:hypothetical protein
MLRVQRSIPIPRISLDRLIKYVVRVGEEPGVGIGTLRGEGLDFGKGRGDITRFFQVVGIVEVDQGSVRLTPLGMRLLEAFNNDVRMGMLLMHIILYRELPQYSILVDTVSERGELSTEELYAEVNRRIRELSPTAWVNEVAFKALLGLSSDLGIIEVRGDRVRLSHLGLPEDCVRRYSVNVGGRVMLRTRDLEDCLSRLVGRGVDSMKALGEAAGVGCIEWVMAPGSTGPWSSYMRITDEECLIRKLTESILGYG